jgi:adenosylcobinamide hydrolase
LILKNLKSCINGINISVSDEDIIIKSESALNILSSAVLNGGHAKSKYIVNHYVHKDYDHQRPEEILVVAAKKMGLNESSVGLLTAVKMENAIVENHESDNFQLTAIVTAGTTNSIQVGQNVKQKQKEPGTINTILIIDANLSTSAMVMAVQVITEAKIAALLDLDIRSQYGGFATGTTTDSIVLACREGGPEIKYAGTATELGTIIGNLIKESVIKAILKRENKIPERLMVLRMEERGIKLKELIETALEMHVPHPGIENKEKAELSLKKIFENVLKDPNVAMLLMSGFRMEEDGNRGLIPGISKDKFKDDPVFILSDEILGMAIANYIAGTRGLFEFYRFDRKKPGILKKLGVFLDDIIGGLIAGASSLMYTGEIKFEDF